MSGDKLMMMSKKFLVLSAVVVMAVGSFFFHSQRQILAAKWHFNDSAFTVKDVVRNKGRTLVKLAISQEQAALNVMAYRPCPYQEDNIWQFQPQQKLELAFYVDEQEVARTVCDASWTVSREVNMLLALPTP